MEPNEANNISRRGFLKRSSVVAIAITVPGVISCVSDKDDKDKEELSECSTTEDILGPYYKAGAPFREDIIPAGNQEPPLIIGGKVFGDCNTVLKDAVVEIWNANEKGEYDTSDNFEFRGQYKTGSDGLYRFKTIIPGRYLNGSTYRPSHIHFRVTAPGYDALVSQIYFKDDPFIDTDPWASTAQAVSRILPLGHDQNGTDMVNFNIYLGFFLTNP